MLIELIGGPADGMILDWLPPEQDVPAMLGAIPSRFVLPSCSGSGSIYISESTEKDFLRYRFDGYCCLRMLQKPENRDIIQDRR